MKARNSWGDEERRGEIVDGSTYIIQSAMCGSFGLRWRLPGLSYEWVQVVLIVLLLRRIRSWCLQTSISRLYLYDF